ncbi:MAG TPA: hypothetical protein V6C97_22080 [Oculatellaceae cyanobacterium]
MEVINALYHGTPNAADQLIPKFNTRTRNGITIWAGKGVFATRDRRIAMLYTFRRNQHVSQGVNLIDEVSPVDPVVLYVRGQSSQEKALDALFGTRESALAYIHWLNPATFSREKGLGVMESVSRVAPAYQRSEMVPTGIERVNPRLEIERYVSDGLMRIQWSACSNSS